MNRKELFEQAIKSLKQAVRNWSETEAPKIKKAFEEFQNVKIKQ
jgi:hypothetical protein